jgi:hypothetical protein
MGKKQWFLLAVLILLAAVYICAFTDWGRHPAIQISHTAAAKPKGVIGPRVKAGSINTAVVSFNLDHAYRLTEVKVVRLDDWQTNKSILPLWHLISSSNSVPTKKFFYGVAIRGMKPAVADVWPEPLEPNVTYRLFLTAGPDKGQHDFSPPPK